MNYEKLVEEDTFLVVMSVRSLHCSCALGKLYQCSFPENPKRSSETLELIHSDLLELPTLLYSKYKWVITFLDDYSSYCRVAFLRKNQMLQKQLKLFSSCGRILLPTLLNACILIIGKSI